MRRNNTVSPLLWAALTLPVLYLAAFLASDYEEGMIVFNLMDHFSRLLERPFAIRWTPHTPKFILGALLIYGLSAVLYCSTRGNGRSGEEHGPAKWDSFKLLGCRYRDKAPLQNIILTQNIRMGLNGKVHRRNPLQIVIGGSGVGKTRFSCKPNLMQANRSFLIMDPKGEMMWAAAPLSIGKGYVIKVFDLIDTDRSSAFSPFPYLKDDKDAMELVDSLIRDTTPKSSTNNGPFWEKSEIALDTTLTLYLLHEALPEEQNLEVIMHMIENGRTREDDNNFQSLLDMFFKVLEEGEPDYVAVREYKIFKQATGKTVKSILLSAAVRLPTFTLPQTTRITSWDDMELDPTGERRQAVFAIIPDSDGTSNCLAGILCTRAFQALYYQADKVHQEALPVSVRLMMGEFCNVSLPDDFGELQATTRFRNIMSTIILQNTSTLKALFKDGWEGLLSNADTLVYLGGDESSIHKYISGLLGREILDTHNRSMSRGSHGPSSVGYQQTGRELTIPDEVRTLDSDYTLLFTRGKRPAMDKKYDILKHPYIKLTEDDGVTPYVHHPRLTYAQVDLSVPFESLDYIEISE